MTPAESDRLDVLRRDCWNLPRSLIRKRAAQDPAEAAHRIIELQDENTFLRRDLRGAVEALHGIDALLEADMNRGAFMVRLEQIVADAIHLYRGQS